MILNIEERLDEILINVKIQSTLVAPENSATGRAVYADPEPALFKAKQAILALNDESRVDELKSTYVDGDVVMTYLPHGVEAPLKSSERIAQLTKSDTNELEEV